MTTAQLWSQESNETKLQTTLNTFPKKTNIGFSVSPKISLDTKQRNGGAFLPFSKERNLCPSPILALASTEPEMEDQKCLETENGFSCPKRGNSEKIGNNNGGVVVIEQGKGTGNSSSDGQATNTGTGNCTNNTTTSTTTSSQAHRKARRCWSPDLHRRFVNALQMLGGSQGKLISLKKKEYKTHVNQLF